MLCYAMGCSFYSEIAMDGSRKYTVLQCREPPEFIWCGYRVRVASGPLAAPPPQPLDNASGRRAKGFTDRPRSCR